MKGRPEDWARVVRDHVHDTKAFVVSSEDPMCLQMAGDEVHHIERRMEHVFLGDLPDVLPDSWFMAVIVCPEDDLSGLSQWMSRHGSDRIRFYLHRRAPTALLAPIRDAGHDLRHVRPEKYTAYGAMHKRLGLDLSDQIYEDFHQA